MSTTFTGIYHWKLGDIALARICKKVYSKVQVVKNEDGIFHDEKGITSDENGIIVTMELCYYVEIMRTKHQMWLPYTCMHLAERSRPFYGLAIKAPVTKPDVSTTLRKRKIKEDHVLPFNIKPSKFKEPDLNNISYEIRQKPLKQGKKIKEDHVLPFNIKPSKFKEPDLNISYEIRQKPLKQGKYENAFKQFVRLGKEHIFDHFYGMLCLEREKNREILNYLEDVDASTEDKLDVVIRNIVTEKEVENYLHQCWRYNFVHKQIGSTNDASDNMKSTTLLKSNGNMPVTVHAPWCLVCGGADRLWECTNCPASFHLSCRREWLINIIHRKSPPKKVQNKVTLIAKILSSTRTISSIQKEKENLEICPSCMWGPKVGYDDVVWHKLSTCPWWPARVLTPGTIPHCLLTRNHSPHQWPLQYYGTLNYSWGDSSRMCLFLPKHTGALQAKDEMLRQAVMDACDDYIAVYLT